MHRPLISIVIPVYNAEKYIAETLDSIRAQTFRDFEVIVIDDGSTDRSFEIAGRFDGVIRMRQDNRGAAAARNLGIGAARGEYIAFLDADDLWMPAKLERQASYLERNPQMAWIYCDAYVFDSATGRTKCRIGERLRLHKGEILRDLMLRCFIPSPTPVVRRTALLRAGIFDERRERRFVEDWSLWLRLAEQHEIALIDEPLARVRLHEENTSRCADPLESYRNKRGILEEALARNPSAGHVARHALAGISASAGLRCLRRRQFAAARQMLFEAMKLCCYGAVL